MDKKNLTTEELLWKIYENTEKTRKYLMWNRIFSIIKILIIVIPLTIAIIYLPSYIEKIMAPYQGLLNFNSQGQQILDNIDLNSLNMNQLQELLK